MYKYRGEWYQINYAGLVYKLHLLDEGSDRHSIVHNSEIVNAVLGLAGYSPSDFNTRGLTEIIKSVNERVDEESINTLIIGYWGACAAPFSGAGNAAAYAAGTTGAVSGVVTTIIGKGDIHDVVRAASFGFNANAFSSAVIVFGKGKDLITLFVAGSSGNALGQGLTADIGSINVYESTIVGLFSAAGGIAGVAAENTAVTIVGSSINTIFVEAGFEASTQADRNGIYRIRIYSEEKKQWITEEIVLPPSDERFDIDDATIRRILEEINERLNEKSK